MSELWQNRKVRSLRRAEIERERKKIDKSGKYIRTAAKYFDIGRAGARKLISRARCTTPEGSVTLGDKVRWKNYCRHAGRRSTTAK